METRKISYDGKFVENKLEEGYREQAKLADEVREALPKRVHFKKCPICGKYLAGTHKKVCQRNNRKKWFKWFLRKIIKK